jgi:flagellar basal body-associated protein FliL
MADVSNDERIESRLNESGVKKPKKANTFLFLGVGSFIGILAVVAGIFLFAPGFTPGPISEEGAGGGQGHIYSMDPFLVNLAAPDQIRYLKVRIAVESTEGKPD